MRTSFGPHQRVFTIIIGNNSGHNFFHIIQWITRDITNTSLFILSKRTTFTKLLILYITITTITNPFPLRMSYSIARK